MATSKIGKERHLLYSNHILLNLDLFQLSLVREVSNIMDPSTDTYTLNDLQQLLKKFEPQFRSRSNPSTSQTSPFIRK